MRHSSETQQRRDEYGRGYAEGVRLYGESDEEDPGGVEYYPEGFGLKETIGDPYGQGVRDGWSDAREGLHE